MDRIFNEQQNVLRTFETDTARALSTADSRSRAFVDELRNQVFQSKTQEDGERERAEQRMNQKLDDIKRSLERYVGRAQSSYLFTHMSSRIGWTNALTKLFISSNARRPLSKRTTDERWAT